MLPFPVTVKDQNETVLYEQDEMKNGQGITADGWIAGERYTIEVMQKTGIGDYKLKIGAQKEKQDISHARTIEDQMEFEDQINRYYFSPEESGSYVIRLNETGTESACQYDCL